MHPSNTLTLKDLIRARFLISGPGGLTTSELGKSLKGFASNRRSASEWTRDLIQTLASLTQTGELEAAGRSRYISTQDGERAALDLLGLAEVPRINWPSLKNTYLLARALGLPAPTGSKERQRIGSAEGLRGAILAAYYRLPTGAYPSLVEARNALLWQRLGDPELAQRLRNRLPSLAGKAFNQGAVMALLLNDMLEVTRDLGWDSALKQLVAKAVGAKRSDTNELRLAVLRRSLAEPTDDKSAVFDLATFAQEVMRAAKATRTGRFGEDRVFISHVWDQLSAAGRDFGLTRDQFKERLTEANKKRLLRLSRADLAHALDQDDVAASETRYLTATFHFLRLD